MRHIQPKEEVTILGYTDQVTLFWGPSPPLPIRSRSYDWEAQRFWHRWEEMGLDQWVVNIITEGYMISFWSRPPLATFPTVKTRYNQKCPTFVSPTNDARALDTDVLTIDLEGMFAYAFPPPQTLPQVLWKFSKMQNCTLLLIAPFWPKQN